MTHIQDNQNSKNKLVLIEIVNFIKIFLVSHCRIRGKYFFLYT